MFWVSRSFDLGDLGVLEKSQVNIFNDYIFEISGFHWSKCTVECAICYSLKICSGQVCQIFLNSFFPWKYQFRKFFCYWNHFILKFLKARRHQFSKNVLWLCGFLGKNSSSFVSPAWKLDNPHCHNTYLINFLTSFH